MEWGKFTVDNWLVDDNIVTEAKVPDTVLTEEDVQNKTMEIGLITDEIIKRSNLKPVTDPISFTKNKGQTMPTEDGLFSEKIFLSTADERKRQFGYIDLKEKFFHPYVFEILCKLNGKIEQVAAGKYSWKIDESGELIKLQDEYDEDGDLIPGNTGLEWLIQNYSKIKFQRNKSNIRNERIRMIENLSKEEIFVSKWLVVPVFYRDVTMTGSQMKIPEINKLYSKLISSSMSLGDNVFNLYDNSIRYNIQSILVDIRQYGQSIIGGKHGIFRKNILGKSIDRGSRDVISTPTMDGCLKPTDNQVDIRHSGIPLSKCLVLGYNFIMRYCLNFFANNFKNVTEYPVYGLKDGKPTMIGAIPIKDQLEIFSTKYIEKQMKVFMNTPSIRFDPIYITTKDGQKIPMRFTGLMSDTGEIVNRPFTWCDLFYMASYETLHDKFVYITRFPIESENSKFPTKVVTLSTLTTVACEVNGIKYTHYPNITSPPTDPKQRAEYEKVMRLIFIDTVTFSNLFLKAIGGDYDGDTTIESIMFSLEANEEAEKIINSARYYLDAAGNLNKLLSNESIFTFYNMTRRD